MGFMGTNEGISANKLINLLIRAEFDRDQPGWTQRLLRDHRQAVQVCVHRLDAAKGRYNVRPNSEARDALSAARHDLVAACAEAIRVGRMYDVDGLVSTEVRA